MKRNWTLKKGYRPQLQVRLPEELHLALIEIASQNGTSLNAAIISCLQERLAPVRKGRPTKTPVEPGRISLGLRVTKEMKIRLDAVAAANARSQSQEAELRIEQSFRDDWIVERLKRIIPQPRD